MNPVDAPWLATALYNGIAVATAELIVPALGPGFSGGEGLYETVRVRNGQPQLLDAHGTRLAASCGLIGATPLQAPEKFPARCAQVIAANAMIEGNLKIFVFKDGAGWSELIMARGVNYAPARYVAGFRILSVSCARREDARFSVKSLANQENIRAKRAALAAGFDEAVMVDPRGVVLEGTATNVFFVKGGEIITSPLPSRILPGVMRAWVIGQKNHEQVNEREGLLAELWQADEVFVTNALLGVMPVVQGDGHRFDLGRNPVTRSLMAALEQSFNPAPAR